VHQIRFRPGLRPRPRWGSLQRSPRPSSWTKGALLLRGRGGEGTGEEEEGKGREGKGRAREGKGRGRERREGKGKRRDRPPLLEIPGSAPENYMKSWSNVQNISIYRKSDTEKSNLRSNIPPEVVLWPFLRMRTINGQNGSKPGQTSRHVRTRARRT